MGRTKHRRISLQGGRHGSTIKEPIGSQCHPKEDMLPIRSMGTPKAAGLITPSPQPPRSNMCFSNSTQRRAPRKHVPGKQHTYRHTHTPLHRQQDLKKRRKSIEMSKQMNDRAYFEPSIDKEEQQGNQSGSTQMHFKERWYKMKHCARVGHWATVLSQLRARTAAHTSQGLPRTIASLVIWGEEKEKRALG